MRTTAIALLCLSVCLVSQGCTVSVWVQHEKYEPTATAANYSEYRERSIALSAFTNNANETTSYYYYSPDNKVIYEASPNLLGYFRACFFKSLQQMGMSVHEYAETQTLVNQPSPWHPAEVKFVQGAPPEIPRFKFQIKSFNERKLVAKIQLLKDNVMVFHRIYTVTMPDPKTDNPGKLAYAAYQMMDKTISMIFDDPEFKQAFLGLPEAGTKNTDPTKQAT